MCDATEALWKMRLQHEEGQRGKDELWSELTQAWAAEEKIWGILMRNHELLERNELKNKGLWEKLVAQEEELEASRQSTKASEEQITSFQEIIRKFSEKLFLVKEKSSKIEKLLKENK